MYYGQGLANEDTKQYISCILQSGPVNPVVWSR